MQIVEDKLTRGDFAIAKKNGISYSRAYQRFNNDGWSREDAITKPIIKQPPSLYSRYKDICKETGISRATFYNRIKDGMEPEIAATTPSSGRGRKKVFTDKQIAIAESNGIPYHTLYMRCFCYIEKWSVERAMTEPVHEEKRVKGDWNLNWE